MRTIINRQTNDLFPTHIKIRTYRESHLTKPRTKLNEQPTSNKAESDILNNVNTPLFRDNKIMIVRSQKIHKIFPTEIFI